MKITLKQLLGNKTNTNADLILILIRTEELKNKSLKVL